MANLGGRSRGLRCARASELSNCYLCHAAGARSEEGAVGSDRCDSFESVAGSLAVDYLWATLADRLQFLVSDPQIIRLAKTLAEADAG